MKIKGLMEKARSVCKFRVRKLNVDVWNRIVSIRVTEGGVNREGRGK